MTTTDTTERRGPGRPPSDTPKQLLTLRLDADIVDRFRATGPGWQSRIGALLTRHAPRRRTRRGRR